jgi:4-hydroxy-tetrahydrodipicolinate synthase
MFRGAMVALVTPFRDDLSVDEEALRALVEAQIDGGIDALIPCGTTGENPTLSGEEQARVIRIVVEQTRKRVPVIAGAGSNDTRHASALAEQARHAGADALLVVTPYYNKPTPDGLVAHYRAVAEAGKLPIVFYHVPGRTSLRVEARTLARVAEAVPEVVAVKEATGDLNVLQSFYSLLAGRLTFLSGDDATVLPFYAAGGEGTISVTANVVPAHVAAVWDDFAAGNLAEARRKHYKMLSLHDAMFWETNPIPVKTALAILGKIRPVFRLPLTPMTLANEARLHALLAEEGLR